MIDESASEQKPVEEKIKNKISNNPVTQSQVDQDLIKLHEKNPSSSFLELNARARDRVAGKKWYERKDNQLKRAEKIAMYDSRTGIRSEVWAIDELNRRMAKAKRTGRPLWVIYWDFDDFKNYNSRYGHDGGDRILDTVAYLRTREEEPIARLHGDEFIHIVDEEIKEEGILKVIARHQTIMKEKSRQVLEDLEKNPAHPAEGHPVEFTTLTFGVAKYGDEATAKELIITANHAMHKAKHLGKNRACVAERIDGNIAYRELPMF